MKDSKIEWTDHTFNPWWGCVKVSPGCAHCYAETFAKRTGNAVWGEKSPRRFFGDKHWNEPRKWNASAESEGERKRVFCASMADVFEDREDLVTPRARLLTLIGETPWLDWLLLTKRPQNISRLMPTLPANVWIGTTAEDQQRWDERLPILMAIPATVRFVSAEPLLGPIVMNGGRPDWLIVGGESGGKARTMERAWVESLHAQCDDLTAFFFKQWGGVDKHATGRQLNGRTFDALPTKRVNRIDSRPPSDSPVRSTECSAKTYGVTHRGSDGETRAYLEDGRVWISDGRVGWLRCDPGVEGYFSPNDSHQRPAK